MARPDLRSFVSQELSVALDPRIGRVARAIAERHANGSRAVLFYGSCLRERQLEGAMLDFYLIVSSYADAYPKSWLALANRLVPPNVFRLESHGLVAKYAVLSDADFRRLCGPSAPSVSVWARFAQPSRLAWAASDNARSSVVDAISLCAPTLLWAAGEKPGEGTLERWKRAFALTYSAELRAERVQRPGSIVDHDPSRYLQLGAAAFEPASAIRTRKVSWSRIRLKGKLLSIVRLAKASITFAGGAEYIAWKINRHAGTNITLSAWQKRHPLLTGLSLLPRLLRTGAVR